MSYNKINFENLPSKKTPINADNLNHMDDGISLAVGRARFLVDELESGHLNGRDGRDGVDGRDGLNGKDGKDGDGRDGKDGATGPQGPIGPIGPAGLVWRGAYSDKASYVKDDAVGYEGNSYFCTKENKGVKPLPQNDSWALLASQGARGEKGENGTNGVNGKDGTNGKDGINGIAGKDGKDGLDGKDGINGIAGKDGKDGRDGTDLGVQYWFYSARLVNTVSVDIADLNLKLKFTISSSETPSIVDMVAIPKIAGSQPLFSFISSAVSSHGATLQHRWFGGSHANNPIYLHQAILLAFGVRVASGSRISVDVLDGATGNWYRIEIFGHSTENTRDIYINVQKTAIKGRIKVV